MNVAIRNTAARCGDRSAQAALTPRWDAASAFLGSRTAILGGAMSQVSKAPLVADISQAGGFGILAAGGRRPESIAHEIAMTRVLTDQPFGANVVTLDPRVDAQIEVCVDLKVSHIVLGGGVPSAAMIVKAKRNGAKVMCFAPSLAIAEQLLKRGADALIAEGHEAGGHVGPVSTAVLAQEMLPLMRRGVLVFVAGGLATGEAVAAYLTMGAAGCQLGTRFLCSVESPAHPAMKAAYLRASARDAVLSVPYDRRIKTIPVRAIANAATGDFLDHQRTLCIAIERGHMSAVEAAAQVESFWSGRLRRAVLDGDVTHGSLMAGQSVGQVTRVEDVASIIQDLTSRARFAIHACH